MASFFGPGFSENRYPSQAESILLDIHQPPIWSHFEIILASFWNHFFEKHAFLGEQGSDEKQAQKKLPHIANSPLW